MKKVGCFLMFLYAFTAIPASANDITLFGGVQRQGSLTLQEAAQSGRTFSLNPTTFGVFGLRAGHGRVFGGEHTIAYTPNFIESQTKAVIYNSNLLLQVPLPKVKPYGTLGLGSIFTFGDSPFDIGNKFAVNYGGGLKVLPAGPVGVRFDVRGYTVPRVQDQTLNVLEVSIGVLFSF
jgi:hypothetical protein